MAAVGGAVAEKWLTALRTTTSPENFEGWAGRGSAGWLRRVVEKIAIDLWLNLLHGTKLLHFAMCCAIEFFSMPAAPRNACAGASREENTARPPVSSPRIIPLIRWRAVEAEEGLAESIVADTGK